MCLSYTWWFYYFSVWTWELYFSLLIHILLWLSLRFLLLDLFAELKFYTSFPVWLAMNHRQPIACYKSSTFSYNTLFLFCFLSVALHTKCCEGVINIGGIISNPVPVFWNLISKNICTIWNSFIHVFAFFQCFFFHLPLIAKRCVGDDVALLTKI